MTVQKLSLPRPRDKMSNLAKESHILLEMTDDYQYWPAFCGNLKGTNKGYISVATEHLD